MDGRISVHTADILDELLDDNDKHEIAKVKSFITFGFRLHCIFGAYFTIYNHFIVLIYNVVITTGSSQTRIFSVFSRKNEVSGQSLGSKGCQCEVNLSFGPHVQNT